MGKEFYSPGEIHYTHEEVLWILHNLGCLRLGDWPAESSGYTDNPRRTINQKAPFITAIEVSAEISARMERCGKDGLILLAIECWKESEEAVAKYLGIPVWSIKKRYKRALKYVSSGPARRWLDTRKRKGVSYQEFKSA